MYVLHILQIKTTKFYASFVMADNFYEGYNQHF